MFNLALELVNNSSRNIFLTGKAGTGKTTFLKYIRDNCPKQLAVVAPTGVAAINAGGVTMHSFFQLPFSPFIPAYTGVDKGNDVTDVHGLLEKLRLNRDKQKLIRELELLIIDEISMVRCDVLDAIDTVMRHIKHRRSERFGGVQVLFIGDMFQLPPVVPEQEWRILSGYYPGPYFFDSKVLQQEPPVYIEFNKIYRQTEERFIRLLNQVRNNEMDEAAFEVLETRFKPGYRRSKNDGYIILTTHNRKADAINELELGKINSALYTFDAQVNGEFVEKAYPADERLYLKTGAQVMFIKNDTEKIRRYYNGKIGTLTRVEGDKIFVKCLDSEDEIEVKKETWENIRYALDKTTGKIVDNVLGTFIQYPLRLAWAITIHKSQGLTFDKAIIDAGDAFAPGQVYVALSRCTSLQGLILETRILKSSLSVDDRISAFSKSHSLPNEIEAELKLAKKNYELTLLKETFDFTLSKETGRSLTNYFNAHSKAFSEGSGDWLFKLDEHLDGLQTTGSRFQAQLKNLYTEDLYNNETIQERVKAAANYFKEKLSECINLLRTSPIATDSSQHARECNDDLKEIYTELSRKRFILEGFENGFSIGSYHDRKRNFKAPALSINTYGGSNPKSEMPHPALYMQLRELRDTICARADLPIYLVAGSNTLLEMSRYLPQSLSELKNIRGFGDAKVKKYGQEFIDVIMKYSESRGLTSLVHEKLTKKRGSEAKPSRSAKKNTRQESYEMFRNGKSINEIALQRNLSIGTIETHLTGYVEEGLLEVRELISPEKLSRIATILEDFSGNSITEIKQKCGTSISYGEIRMAIAAKKLKGENQPL
jgi:hypothetical protein